MVSANIGRLLVPLIIGGLLSQGYVASGAEQQRSARPAAESEAASPSLGTADAVGPTSDQAENWSLRRTGSRQRALRFRSSWFDVFGRSHMRVRSAFREIVSKPARSTAHVLCGGEQVALGTIVSANGYIVTKASELKDQVQCQLVDGRLLDAKVVGVQQRYDLAMLKVAADNLSAVLWSDSAAPPVGSFVASPGLSEIPIAIGVVSVSPRSIAAPRGLLGVYLEQSDLGPQITAIEAGSSAEKAGLRVKDVVLRINGASVDSRHALIAMVGQFQAGDRLRLSVRRGGQDVELVATLGDGFGDRSRAAQPGSEEDLGGPLSGRRTGFPVAIQHDSILLPSACGGPLVDLEGKTIGVNIARADRVSTYALPADAVRALLADLQSGKLAPPPALEERPNKLAQSPTPAFQVSEHVDSRSRPTPNSAQPGTTDRDRDGKRPSSAPTG